MKIKPRLWFDKKHRGRDLHVCFPDGGQWYIYPHDELLEVIVRPGLMAGTESWEVKGLYHDPNLSAQHRKILEPYRLAAQAPGE